MEILIGIVIGLFISFVFHEAMMKNILKKYGIVTPEQAEKLLGIIDEHRDPTQRDQEKRVQQVKVENIKGILYAYTLPEEQYIGQADSYGALLDVLKDRLDTDAVDIQEEHHDS